ncbi:MAG TPA: DUF2877 domain-containing protein [Candidatus Cybelea sp.]|nr:DUF2877 domain-containing protein [Candidatus Cybelea sp.]
MRLAALTAGIGAEAGRFAGTVHSVFVRACNIMTEQNLLLALVTRETGAVPRGFQLATPQGFSFADHLRPGARVACRAGILRIAGSDLSIDLRPARPWRGAPQARVAAAVADGPARSAVAIAWRVAWTALEDHQGAAGFARVAAGPIDALVRATSALHSCDAAAALMRLVGLGDGLTPAGDDLLAGYLAGLWRAAGTDPARRAFLDALAADARFAAERTNAISRSYLEAAAEGEVAEPLAFLADRIGAGDAARTASAVAAALSVGASSGAAGTLGLLLALRAWSGVSALAGG